MVCNVVFNVSIGVNNILKQAEDAEAAMVLTAIGRFLVVSSLSNRAKAPAFAAVSPNRDKGP